MSKKITFTFTLPEDQEELNDAINAPSLKSALWDVSQKVFRPARKHGYSQERLQRLIDKNPDAVEIISFLEAIFYEILDEHGVDL